MTKPSERISTIPRISVYVYIVTDIKFNLFSTQIHFFKHPVALVIPRAFGRSMESDVIARVCYAAVNIDIYPSGDVRLQLSLIFPARFERYGVSLASGKEFRYRTVKKHMRKHGLVVICDERSQNVLLIIIADRATFYSERLVLQFL